jgi:hypothetical protein
MYLTPSAWSALTRTSAPRNSCEAGEEPDPLFEVDAADAEAISAFEISMMNLCDFL